jgi:hypothetical protein
MPHHAGARTGRGKPTSPALGPIVDGFRRHGSATGEELAQLGDLIRFRPLAVAARELAVGLERGAPEPTAGWWSRFVDADFLADAVRARLSA